jgi:hypothetical protein
MTARSTYRQGSGQVRIVGVCLAKVHATGDRGVTQYVPTVPLSSFGKLSGSYRSYFTNPPSFFPMSEAPPPMRVRRRGPATGRTSKRSSYSKRSVRVEGLGRDWRAT